MNESLRQKINARNKSFKILTTFGEPILDFDLGWLLRATLKVLHTYAVHRNECPARGGRRSNTARIARESGKCHPDRPDPPDGRLMTAQTVYINCHQVLA